MSKAPAYGPDFTPKDSFQEMLIGAAKILLGAGLLASVTAIGFLVFTFITFSGGANASVAQAESNIALFSKVLMIGLVGVAVGSTYLFWGEETLGFLQLFFGGALFFAPLYLPSLATGGQQSEVGERALGAIQTGGAIFSGIAVVVLLADIASRMRLRVQQGIKADQLKYGKGLKEEKDVQNVFLGKCWQLPFCRKFVRERCPIYHAKRTCWRERVGCMCEEQVIRNAMENKPIPKDQVAAAKYIPYNNRLTMQQKMERCRQCVIYNEHQKHKYKLALPGVLLVFGLIYAVFRTQLLGTMDNIIRSIDKAVGYFTYRQAGAAGQTGDYAPAAFQELLLIAIMIIALAYALKVVEYAIFKLKM
ncbi:MAG TPA: hypothetical protein VM328_00275 [Fimbriimonadaceae bacterium]|nr:hypothetical protein [Fimbriimonadaceae bacterium]